MNITKKQKEKNQKERKNLIILAAIFAGTIFLVLYLCRWYSVYNEYKREIPVIRDSLYEIVNEDFEHYLLDNPTTVVYMCTASNDKCRNFEKKFKKYLRTVELTDEIVYLNLSGLDQDDFVNSFNDKYISKSKTKTRLTTDYPAFVFFEDGEVKSIIQENEDDELTLTEVKQFLKLNEIGE